MRSVVLWGRVLAGLMKHYLTGRCSEASYQAFVKLHCDTNGASTDLLSRLVSRVSKRRALLPAEGVLGVMTPEKLETARAAIEKDGFMVFEAKLSGGICDRLTAVAGDNPAMVEAQRDGQPTFAIYDPAAPISKTYRMPETVLVNETVIQEIMADQTLMAVAQAYVGTLPVLDTVNLWWSAIYGTEPGSSAAQLFHFDMDRIKWLKFFFYLTDVDENSGPHVYVKGSHRSGHPAASSLLAHGYVRLPDKDVVEAYGRENVVEITGSRGTIVAVDTRGFHKGKVPITGHRLVLELEYSNSLFGGAYINSRVEKNRAPAFATAREAFPMVYQKYQ